MFFISFVHGSISHLGSLKKMFHDHLSVILSSFSPPLCHISLTHISPPQVWLHYSSFPWYVHILHSSHCVLLFHSPHFAVALQSFLCNFLGRLHHFCCPLMCSFRILPLLVTPHIISSCDVVKQVILKCSIARANRPIHGGGYMGCFRRTSLC